VLLARHSRFVRAPFVLSTSWLFEACLSGLIAILFAAMGEGAMETPMEVQLLAEKWKL
ncbi:unnamed protein product, partial [Musa textilis]